MADLFQDTRITLTTNGSTTNSSSTYIKFVKHLAIQIVTAGTNFGSYQIQGSVDNTNFYDIAGAIYYQDGTTTSQLITLTNAYYPYVRIAYTYLSGTASTTTNIFIWGKL